MDVRPTRAVTLPRSIVSETSSSAFRPGRDGNSNVTLRTSIWRPIPSTFSPSNIWKVVRPSSLRGSIDERRSISALIRPCAWIA